MKDNKVIDLGNHMACARLRLISALVILLGSTTTNADWRGLFDDYGKTYQECLTIQENELLKNPNIKTSGINGAPGEIG